MSMLTEAWLQHEIEDLPSTGTWEGNPLTALAGVKPTDTPASITAA